MNPPATITLADNATALTAMENSAIVCQITPAGLLRFSGEDSPSFLHGQLSSDVKALSENSAQYSSYSTPKGRMLASFLIFRQQGDYWLQLSNELVSAMQKRLSMFIMRSKTRCIDATSERALIGLAGPRAEAIVQQITGIAPGTELSVLHAEEYSLASLPGKRFQFVAMPDSAPRLWQQLVQAGCTPASPALWQLSDIRAGIPWIGTATQEEFVLQMTNLDLIGAVSFTKGCYPGQEIVARTRYLGKVKRRMYRAQLQTDTVEAGQDVFSSEMNGQPSGKILCASMNGANSWEALIVCQMSSLEHGLHLGSLTGPALTLLSLPYAVE